MLVAPATLRRLVRARELLAGDASVRDIATRVGVSPFHFIRQFAAVFGATPHQYRIAARLDRAKALLATGRGVTEVCLAVGAESLGSFSALFARRVGMPPSAYRRRALVQVAWPGPVHCLDLFARAFATLEKQSAAPAGTLGAR